MLPPRLGSRHFCTPPSLDSAWVPPPKPRDRNPWAYAFDLPRREIQPGSVLHPYSISLTNC